MTDPDLPGVLLEAQTAWTKGDWPRAADAWNEVARHAPKHPKAIEKACIALYRAGQSDAADATLAKAIARDGMKPAYLAVQGETAMERHDWRTALEHWHRLRRTAPRRPKGWHRAAQAHLALNETERAEALCLEGLERWPHDKALLARYVEVALRGDQRKTAATRLAAALALHPDDRVLRRLEKRLARPRPRPGRSAAPRPATLRARLARLRSRLKRLLGPRPAAPVPVSDPSASDIPDTTARQARPDKARIRALSQRLTELQRQRSPAGLQQRIDEARGAWATRLPLPDHAGLMRHFDRAETDPRLARLLAGDTDRNPPRAPGDPIRVVFFFPRVTQTDNLMPLYEQMHGDPRFHPLILCCRTEDKAQADAHAFYAAKYPARDGHEVIDGGHVSVTPSFYELDADMVFYHTPYSLNAQRPFYLRADFAARHARVANVTYGYPLLSLDTKSHHVYAGGHVKLCDMAFAESPACIEPYGRHLDPARIHVTGYTKVDEFRRHLDPTPFEDFAPGAERLDVIWTPHWQLPGDPKGDTETSNFLRYHEIMLKVAARPDVKLHVRPHPLLRQRLSNLKIMSFRRYDAIMDQFRAAGAEVYPAEEGVSYVPALMKAAVLISDFSSLVAEYTITNRPIIFCRTEDVWTNGRWIGDFGRALIENCTYPVDDAAGLEASLETILSSRRHPKAKQMARFVEEHALFPEGSACARICNVIESRMRAA
ncbi:CDP-glycerol glycerophosphotransferase family protein [Limimaricola sp. ASW11-118]|uniref:CDP-glycerol glycerophosphotransferase family protein n=1 Tax=Limimaricola litoreus TaxID=2955316 RepID=A0A9X2FN80_9RHOB|nr:CDP-glycerol glycerophosphotransferase family protein [Limimaricola litoreus]MCP1167000.1 CDP-glycerol glycerophosphotransferase family protein [Limimaricola litoreus]